MRAVKFLLFILFFSVLVNYFVLKGVAQKSIMNVNANLSSRFNAMLDDFNDGNDLNNWLYNTYAGGTGGTCDTAYVAGAYEGPKCLRLRYSVPNPGDFSWYASKLGHQNASLSNYNGLSFWVRGSNGGETLKVELKTVNCNGVNRSNASLYVNDFLPGSGITTSWQQALIPFKNFANITNFSQLEELTLVFEHDQSSTNGSPLSGAVFVDAIRFTNKTGGFTNIKQDFFSDRIPRNALGGNMGWGGVNATGIASWDSIQYHTSSYSLKFTYDVTVGGSFAWVYSLFGGGTTGFAVQQCNFTNCGHLSFWTKAGRNTTNMALQVEIDTDDSYPPSCTYLCVGIRTNWQKYSLPLTNACPIDRRKIAKLTFVMVNSWLDAADQNTSIYFDEVQFEK